nr:MAG TPA: hypothetical protein [Caudoviricetes sp.]
MHGADKGIIIYFRESLYSLVGDFFDILRI